MLSAAESDKSVLPARADREQLPASNNGARDADRKRVAHLAAAPGPAESGLAIQPSKSSCSSYLAKCLRMGYSCAGMAPTV